MGDADEMAMQIRLLNIPLGRPGSGMIRYGAAMLVCIPADRWTTSCWKPIASVASWMAMIQ
ncbi:MAG: hypothetical protein R3D29_08290 [Nitratireductor sp.]